ncbi:UvrD-helicase domain-containing protein [Humibacter ginsengisoli]
MLGQASKGEIALTGYEVSVESSGNVRTLPAVERSSIRIERSGTWWTLSVAGVAPLRGLSSKTVREFQSAVEQVTAEHDASVANVRIREWWEEFQSALGAAWVAHRWFTEESIATWEGLRNAAIPSSLSGPAQAVLIDVADPAAWDAVRSSTTVRDRVRTQNESLIEAQLKSERTFFDSIEGTPLTEEQARAVICFDNRVLLVASAGSGKTSTIVAKAGWTVRQRIAKPEEILLLAFNSAAAREMAERLATRLRAAGIPADGVRAQTFHAFGLRVIGEATGKKPRLGAGLEADDGLGLLARVVADLKASSRNFAAKWWVMQNVLGTPLNVESELDPDSYDRDTRRIGFRTLDGDVVKSAGERAVANWLIQSGIDVLYEYPYEVDVADAQHSQYRPDFYYPEAGVWHEHWAFVDGENVPPSFDGYLESRAWKKALHAEHGTKLIETSASQLDDGTLFDSLDAQLRAHGIIPDFDPNRPGNGEPLLSDREMLTLFRTFLTHAKSNQLGDTALRSRLRRNRAGVPNWRESTFLDLFGLIRAEWDRRLKAAGELDFDDMLNDAIDAIESGRWKSPYRVVLVDEFQDASRARARMVNALVEAPDRHLFAVGDDWQSIYRFAGADITAMTRFEVTFGRGSLLRLERTFRNSQELSTIAGDFVMKNPAQLRKTVRSSTSLPNPITLVRTETNAGVTSAITRRINEIHASLSPGARKRQGAWTISKRGRTATATAVQPARCLLPDHPRVQGSGGRPCHRRRS